MRYGGSSAWSSDYPAFVLIFNWYFDQDTQDYYLNNIEVSNSKTGLYVYVGGNHRIHIFDNSFHDNSDYGIYADLNYPYALTNINAINNWWGSESGPYHQTLNPLGTGNKVSDKVDFIPWLMSDPFPLPVVPPTLSELNQFKSDGITEISESDITTEDSVVFQAKVDSPANNHVKLQVEMKEFHVGFDESEIIESELMPSGSTASISRFGLVDGKYKWRARAMDELGNKSDWQEFGTAGNIDLEVKLVPLYTQVESDYPSKNDTERWAIQKYGTGNYNNCWDRQLEFSSIRRCGCAITSMVMLGRYYNLNNGIDNTDVNPGAINTWLTSNNGYSTDGKLKWNKAVEYLSFIDQSTGKKMARLEFDWETDWNVPSTDSRINNYVNSAQPIVAYSKKFGHYFVIDSKLASTYKVKDPAWYNTKILNDTENLADYIRGYNNYFNTANLFTYLETPKRFSPAVHFVLASPAELLIIDPSGNKLGKDQDGIEYNQIPDGVYGEDYPVITSDTPLDESELHKTKEIHIENPTEGDYNIQVIGTGQGEYTVDSLIYDADGNSHSQTLTGNTEENLITEYALNFTPDEPENISIEIVDITPPEAKIYFDKDNKQLKVEGIDNISTPTIKQQDNTYIIQDASDNTLRLVFDKLKQKKKEIKVKLESLQYNNEPIIELPETELRFEWSLNKDQAIKELEQKIEVKNQFTVKAKYNHQKNETKIKIKEENKKETEQTLPGLVIIKLITKSGSLDFEF